VTARWFPELAPGTATERHDKDAGTAASAHLGGAPTGTRSVVEKLGVFGGVARGAVIALTGVFLTIAAVRFSPSKAEGIDGSLRAFAHTPVGPFLLEANRRDLALMALSLLHGDRVAPGPRCDTRLLAEGQAFLNGFIVQVLAAAMHVSVPEAL
jgi:Domain of Unknown Function (DUF1206)